MVCTGKVIGTEPAVLEMKTLPLFSRTRRSGSSDDSSRSGGGQESLSGKGSTGQDGPDQGGKPLMKSRTVYFDSGTGRGKGVEIKVVDDRGKNLTPLLVPPNRLTRHGTALLSPGRTNNYGELLACYHALKAALKHGYGRVAGDSKLVLDYWSKGHVTNRAARANPDLRIVAHKTAQLRRTFEARGGKMVFVRGGQNPADLGFHRKV